MYLKSKALLSVVTILFVANGCSKKDSGDTAPTLGLSFPLVSKPTLSLDVPKKSIKRVTYSPDGSKILVGGEGGFIRLYDKKGAVIRDFQGHTKSVIFVAFTTDNKRFVSASYDNTARLWDIASGNELKSYKTSASIMAAALSKDGKRLLTGDVDGYLTMWDVESGGELLKIEMPTDRYKSGKDGVTSVVFLPGGQSAISGNSESVRLWDLNTGKEIRQYHSEGLPGTEVEDLAINYVSSVSISEDASRISAASERGDGYIFVWELQTGKQIAIVNRYRGSIYDFKDKQDEFGSWILGPVVLSPDGSKVIAGIRDAIRVWDINAKKEVYRFQPDDSEFYNSLINGLALSPDLKSIASANMDGYTQVWATGDLFSKDK